MANLDSIDELAQAIGQSVYWVVSSSSSWWLDSQSDKLAQGQIEQLRQLLIPLAVILATGGVMWQGIRMVLTRKSEPLVDIGRGLWNIVWWGAIGTIAPLVALRAGDEFSSWVLSQATGADSAAIQARLVSAFSVAEIPAPGAVVILGIIVMIAVFVQSLLMLLREFAVLLIAVLLQTAAASTLARPTGKGVTRMLGWSAALIMYKPIVALIYAMAFLVIGPAGAPSARPFFVVTAALLLSLVAFPATLSFFQRSVRSLDGGWEARQKKTSTASARATAVTTSHAGAGGAAGSHARYLSQAMPNPGAVASSRRVLSPPAMGTGAPIPHNQMVPKWLQENPNTRDGSGLSSTNGVALPKSAPPRMEPAPAIAEPSARPSSADDEGRRGQ